MAMAGPIATAGPEATAGPAGLLIVGGPTTLYTAAWADVAVFVSPLVVACVLLWCCVVAACRLVGCVTSFLFSGVILFAGVGVTADTPLDVHDATCMNADDACKADDLDDPSPSSFPGFTCIRDIRLLRLVEEEGLWEVELWGQYDMGRCIFLWVPLICTEEVVMSEIEVGVATDVGVATEVGEVDGTGVSVEETGVDKAAAIVAFGGVSPSTCMHPLVSVTNASLSSAVPCW